MPCGITRDWEVFLFFIPSVQPLCLVLLLKIQQDNVLRSISYSNGAATSVSKCTLLLQMQPQSAPLALYPVVRVLDKTTT